MKASTENDELLPDSVAVAILGVTKGTLASWRSQGRGAAYVKIGSGPLLPHRPYRLCRLAPARRRRSPLINWMRCGSAAIGGESGRPIDHQPQ
jgi:hypothetical protein